MADGLHVLFSAHGVPESYIEAGDPYLRHTKECVRLISKDVADQLCNDRTRPAGMSKALGLQLGGSLLGTGTGRGREGAGAGTGRGAGAGTGTVTGTGTGTGREGVSTGKGTNSAAPAVQFHLSFQSRVGPVQWLK